MPNHLTVGVLAQYDGAGIATALRSARGVASSWVVLTPSLASRDTDAMEQVTHGWPGQVVNASWQDLHDGRSRLISTSREFGATWLLQLNPFEKLETSVALMEELRLTAGSALALARHSISIDFEALLFRTGTSWRYLGALCDPVATEPLQPDRTWNANIVDEADGAARIETFRRERWLLRRAVQASPQSASAWYRLGTAYEVLNHRETALACFRRAVGVSTGEQRYVALVGVGRQALALGRRASAEAALIEAALLEPKRREATAALCALHNEHGAPALTIERLHHERLPVPIPPEARIGIRPADYDENLRQQLVRARRALDQSL